MIQGAGSGTRTRMSFRTNAFEASAYAYSAIPASASLSVKPLWTSVEPHRMLAACGYRICTAPRPGENLPTDRRNCTKDHGTGRSAGPGDGAPTR